MAQIDPAQKKRWTEKRKAILKRDKYIDQVLLRGGEKVEADVVHHIFPKEQYPQYTWKDWNLISISRDTHELLHNRVTGGLSDIGLKLLKETGEKQGIKTFELVLVIGLPGSGKTTYVQTNMGNALAYDLDYIAGAFRLKTAHAEYNEAARRMANSMATAFSRAASSFCSKAYIIRSAPSVEEVARYDPDTIVICNHLSDITNRPDYHKTDTSYMVERINEVKQYAKDNFITLIEA